MYDVCLRQTYSACICTVQLQQAEDQTDGEDIYIDIESSEAQDIDENGPPPEIPSNSEIMGHLQDILLWVGSKEKSTQDHIRQVESLISEFGRIQFKEKR